jgi:hypothetical protein
MIISLFVYVLAAVLLAFFWYMGDVEFRTKVIMTLVYLASWDLVFWNSYAVIAVQALVSAVLGWLTFGAEFLGRRR